MNKIAGNAGVGMAAVTAQWYSVGGQGFIDHETAQWAAKVLYDESTDCDGDGIADPFCAVAFVQAYLSSASSCLPKVLMDYSLVQQKQPANRALCPA